MSARGKTAMGERGSALVITLMLLVILTAIGIYAISISTSEMNIAIHSRVGTATLNSADAGANFGIDFIPNLYLAETEMALPDQSRYFVVSRTTGVMTLRPGYGANYRFADFEVTSRGVPPPAYTGERRVQAVVDFGPLPMGTMY
ncbi:MAG: pilus assembly PilX N-terminal domain-containing protein [Deltaproteobacteria bacterium]|nr:pilus assembly PilX N-terminal domain-containing protein [Deltaproteobacteria bacterium]